MINKLSERNEKKNHDGKNNYVKIGGKKFKDKNGTKKAKIRIAEILVDPIGTYGTKGWIMRKKDREKT